MDSSGFWKGSQETLEGYKKLFEYFRENYPGDWIFRGQHADWILNTALERACENSGLTSVQDSQKIEKSMIREFKRLYDGSDRDRVEKDTLYALSVMRHYGAPTRLLDFTYSKYVGIYFALEYANDIDVENDEKSCAIWCINQEWLVKAIKNTSHEVKKLVDEREDDDLRIDETFLPLYLNNRYDFIGWENPIALHQRLHIQQGTFLCPGNISKPFMVNLKELKGWEEKSSIMKVVCRMKVGDLHKAFDECRRMNISRESLFPGLDGFAQSMKYHMYFYKNL
jgi:hypothetical protein